MSYHLNEAAVPTFLPVFRIFVTEVVTRVVVNKVVQSMFCHSHRQKLNVQRQTPFTYHRVKRRKTFSSIGDRNRNLYLAPQFHLVAVNQDPRSKTVEQ